MKFEVAFKVGKTDKFEDGQVITVMAPGVYLTPEVFNAWVDTGGIPRALLTLSAAERASHVKFVREMRMGALQATREREKIDAWGYDTSWGSGQTTRTFGIVLIEHPTVPLNHRDPWIIDYEQLYSADDLAALRTQGADVMPVRDQAYELEAIGYRRDG